MSVEATDSPRLVRDLMSVGVTTCSPDTPIADLARSMLDSTLEGVVVLGDQGHALGTVSWNELVEAYAQGGFHDLTAEDVMQAGMSQVPPDIPLAAAAQIMQDRGTRVLFMGHHAGGIVYPAAVLTYKHFLRHIAMRDADDLRDLGIGAEREGPLDTFIKKRDSARTKAE